MWLLGVVNANLGASDAVAKGRTPWSLSLVGDGKEARFWLVVGGWEALGECRSLGQGRAYGEKEHGTLPMADTEAQRVCPASSPMFLTS